MGMTKKDAKPFYDLLLKKKAELVKGIAHIANDALKTSQREATGDLSALPMIFLGDLRLAVAYGDREETSVETSRLGPTFGNRQMAIRGINRVDLVLHDLGDAINVGAIIALIGE